MKRPAVIVGSIIGALLAAYHLIAQPTEQTFTWDAVTQDENNVTFPAGNEVDRYGLACAHSAADLATAYTTGEFAYNANILPPLTVHKHTFDVGDWVCTVQAHNAAGWSAPSNTVSFTIKPAPLPFLKPKATNLRIG